jgi:hypothetical protein
VAASLEQTTIPKKKEVSGFSQGLLLGKSTTLRHKAHSKGFAQSRRRASVRRLIKEQQLKAISAPEFHSENHRFAWRQGCSQPVG